MNFKFSDEWLDKKLEKSDDTIAVMAKSPNSVLNSKKENLKENSTSTSESKKEN